MATEEVKFQPKDYKSDQYVRWCPGCGDHAVLNCLHKAMAEVGVAPHNMAVNTIFATIYIPNWYEVMQHIQEKWLTKKK